MAAAAQNENSYRLPSDTFPVSKVKAEVDKILAARFDKVQYDEGAFNLLKQVTDEIYKATKAIIPPRYKYAVHLTLSEKIGQAFFSGSMCLWDEEHDNYVTTSFETSTILVVAVIFGSLLE